MGGTNKTYQYQDEFDEHHWSLFERHPEEYEKQAPGLKIRSEKRQFCHEVVSHLQGNWHSFNPRHLTSHVMASNGSVSFFMYIGHYNQQYDKKVKISGEWPKDLTRKTGSKYVPNNSVEIGVSYDRDPKIAARDIERRFLDWFLEAHAEMDQRAQMDLAKHEYRHKQIVEGAKLVNGTAKIGDRGPIFSVGGDRHYISKEWGHYPAPHMVSGSNHGKFYIGLDRLNYEQFMEILEKIGEVMG